MIGPCGDIAGLHSVCINLETMTVTLRSWVRVLNLLTEMMKWSPESGGAPLGVNSSVIATTVCRCEMGSRSHFGHSC